MAAASTGAAPKLPQNKNAVMLTEEQMAKQPLEEKAREALLARAGKIAGEGFRVLRDENKRPAGRPDEATVSRHERVPPARVVLMFNCHISSFELLAGDMTTLPEAEVISLKSLTSGKELGRVKIAPEKGTPVEELSLIHI